MRQCPSNSYLPLRRRNQRGFTLIESVIVVSMVAVFATLAGPRFGDFMIQQGIRNAAFDLMSDLTFARSEAVKRNATVKISNAGTWTAGWTIAAGATTLRQHPALSPNVTLTLGSSSLDFNLNGRASTAASFTIDDAGGRATIVARCVSVDPSGRPQSTEGSCS